MITPATIEPVKFPSPPITMTINAISVKSRPMVGVSVNCATIIGPGQSEQANTDAEGQAPDLPDADAHQRGGIAIPRDGSHLAGRNPSASARHRRRRSAPRAPSRPTAAMA